MNLNLIVAISIPIILLLTYLAPNSILPIWNKIGLLYKKPVYYIFSMSVYHVLIPLYLVIGIQGFKPQTMVGIGLGDLNFASTVSHDIIAGSIANIFFAVIIMVIDLIFFLILFFEFPDLHLTPGKITIMEIVIFVLALYSPGLRMAMLFLSLNTLQITIFYKLMKWIPITKYVFITGGYILLIKVLTYPVRIYF